MNHQPPHILIIEDEPGIALILYTTLSKNGYRVDTAKTGTSGLRKAAHKNFDIVLLDLSLPDLSGLHICRELRAQGFGGSIIVLTAEGDIRAKVQLFDAGADDYVTKPFSADELQARIRACLRDIAAPSSRPDLVAGPLTLDYAGHLVRRQGTTIQLRRKEFALLECLMQNAGRTVTRLGLLQYAWDNTADAWTNTVDVHIKHLRDKIDRPFVEPLITTVHGVGYKLEVPAYTPLTRRS